MEQRLQIDEDFTLNVFEVKEEHDEKDIRNQFYCDLIKIEDDETNDYQIMPKVDDNTLLSIKAELDLDELLSVQTEALPVNERKVEHFRYKNVNSVIIIDDEETNINHVNNTDAMRGPQGIAVKQTEQKIFERSCATTANATNKEERGNSNKDNGMVSISYKPYSNPKGTPAQVNKKMPKILINKIETITIPDGGNCKLKNKIDTSVHKKRNAAVTKELSGKRKSPSQALTPRVFQNNKGLSELQKPSVSCRNETQVKLSENISLIVLSPNQLNTPTVLEIPPDQLDIWPIIDLPPVIGQAQLRRKAEITMREPSSGKSEFQMHSNPCNKNTNNRRHSAAFCGKTPSGCSATNRINLKDNHTNLGKQIVTKPNPMHNNNVIHVQPGWFDKIQSIQDNSIQTRVENNVIINSKRNTRSCKAQVSGENSENVEIVSRMRKRLSDLKNTTEGKIKSNERLSDSTNSFGWIQTYQIVLKSNRNKEMLACSEPKKPHIPKRQITTTKRPQQVVILEPPTKRPQQVVIIEPPTKRPKLTPYTISSQTNNLIKHPSVQKISTSTTEKLNLEKLRLMQTVKPSIQIVNEVKRGNKKDINKEEKTLNSKSNSQLPRNAHQNAQTLSEVKRGNKKDINKEENTLNNRKSTNQLPRNAHQNAQTLSEVKRGNKKDINKEKKTLNNSKSTNQLPRNAHQNAQTLSEVKRVNKKDISKEENTLNRTSTNKLTRNAQTYAIKNLKELQQKANHGVIIKDTMKTRMNQLMQQGQGKMSPITVNGPEKTTQVIVIDSPEKIPVYLGEAHLTPVVHKFMNKHPLGNTRKQDFNTLNVGHQVVIFPVPNSNSTSKMLVETTPKINSRIKKINVASSGPTLLARTAPQIQTKQIDNKYLLKRPGMVENSTNSTKQTLKVKPQVNLRAATLNNRANGDISREIQNIKQTSIQCTTHNYLYFPTNKLTNESRTRFAGPSKIVR